MTTRHPMEELCEAALEAVPTMLDSKQAVIILDLVKEVRAWLEAERQKPSEPSREAAYREGYRDGRHDQEFSPGVNEDEAWWASDARCERGAEEGKRDA